MNIYKYIYTHICIHIQCCTCTMTPARTPRAAVDMPLLTYISSLICHDTYIDIYRYIHMYIFIHICMYIFTYDEYAYICI